MVEIQRRAAEGEINYHLFDRFTLAHFLIGVGYGLIPLHFGWTLFLAVAWELVEDFLKARLPRIFPHATRDTLRNALGDVLAVLSGWALPIYLF